MSRDRLERFVERLENLMLEEKRHYDPPSAHHIPHDLSLWFLEVAKRGLNGDGKSLVRGLGLIRPRGRPVDPNKSKNLDLAERALIRKMQGKTWSEVNTEIFADRAEPPDERYLRTLVARYQPVIMQKWREQLRQRWVAGSEARKNQQIQKNRRKGRTWTANSR